MLFRNWATPVFNRGSLIVDVGQSMTRTAILLLAMTCFLPSQEMGEQTSVTFSDTEWMTLGASFDPESSARGYWLAMDAMREGSDNIIARHKRTISESRGGFAAHTYQSIALTSDPNAFLITLIDGVDRHEYIVAVNAEGKLDIEKKLPNKALED